MDDGSVVIADTMALDRGEPRLLHYDRSGDLRSVIDLADAKVASISDVVTDGSTLAILDIFLPQNRYRVVYMSPLGDVQAVVEVPSGYHLEDGLTGLEWDDEGVLLEFELGRFHARLGGDGVVQADATPVHHGLEVRVAQFGARTSEVAVGEVVWTVERATDLGGAAIIGLSANGILGLVVDEVDTNGISFEVTRRVQRYTADGQWIDEMQLDPADQYVEIARPFELDREGHVLYMAAMSTYVDLISLTSQQSTE